MTNLSPDPNETPAVGIGFPPDWPGNPELQKAHDDALAAALAVDPALVNHLPQDWAEWRREQRREHFRNIAEWGGPLPANGPNDTAANDGRSFLQRLADHEAVGGSSPRDESFMQRKAKRDAVKAAAAAANGETAARPDLPAVPPVGRPTTGGYRAPDDPYVIAAEDRELSNVATAQPGTRNGTLNNAALKLARLPIPRDQLRAELIKACNTNGLVRDDGMGSVLKTIRSAFGKADREGPRVIPDMDTLGAVSEVEYDSLAPKRDESTGGQDGDGDEPTARERRIRREVARLLENDEVRERYGQITRPQTKNPVARNIADLLTEDLGQAEYLIDEIHPEGARVLLVAQFKAGKSTIVGNAIRSLAEGDSFLGRFTVNRRPAHVVLIDTELSPRMLQKWLRDQGIHRRNVTVFALRETGVAAFNILDVRVRAEWAARLRDLGADYLILDCLRPCLDALGLSEDKEAGRFLTAFDQLLADADIADAMVVHHAGHGSERSRGDSRLLDWPDALWNLNRADPDDPTSARYFKALGRDVDLAEGLLTFNPATRHLTYSNGSRKARAADSALTALVDVLREHHATEGVNAPGISKTKLAELADASRNAATTAIEKGLRTGLFTAESAINNAKLIRLTNPCEGCGGPLGAGQSGRHLSCSTDTDDWMTDVEN